MLYKNVNNGRIVNIYIIVRNVTDERLNLKLQYKIYCEKLEKLT